MNDSQSLLEHIRPAESYAKTATPRPKPRRCFTLYYLSSTICLYGFTTDDAWLPFATAVTQEGSVVVGKGLLGIVVNAPVLGFICNPEIEPSSEFEV